MTRFSKAQTDASEAIVIICDGRTFIAGADITEFGKPPQEPFLPDLLNVIEDSTKPVVAAIHGTALGGGFETTLAAHYRCALASARSGFPKSSSVCFPAPAARSARRDSAACRRRST